MQKRLSVVQNDDLELEKLREMARVASIFHGDTKKFHRNPNLTYVVHASMNIFQVIINGVIITFHHVHHLLNRRARDKDASVPYLPEEENPIFLVYPLCMMMSAVFAILWIFTDIFIKKPLIAITGCFVSASLVLIVGIVEMRHADIHIDVANVSDDELLVHPIFVHNFTMCLISILCMVTYLVQAWTLYDYYLWKKDGVEREEEIDTGRPSSSEEQVERGTKTKKTPGEFDPIPELETFPSLTLSEPLDVNKEPIVLYCCCIDWYNYIKQHWETSNPLHEFQVIHVM